MAIITENEEISNKIENRYNKFIKRFSIPDKLRSVGAAKEKGVSVRLLFTFLLGLVFTRKNLYETMAGTRSKPEFCKNTIYRFLAMACVNWEAFIRKLAAAVIPEVRKLTSDKRKVALILDDTPYWRNRSKAVEMLSRCYDHSEKRYYNGFNMLNLGWSDGQTFMPVDFRMLASGKDENLLHGLNAAEDKRTIATKRRTDARTDKPTLALKMLKDAIGTASQAQYVLFDSWFSSPSFMISVKGLGYDVVARLKNHENFQYLLGGEKMSLSKIWGASRKRRGMSRYLLSVNVSIRHDAFAHTVPAKIVFVRDRSNRKKWIAIISTDTSLTEDEIIALYGKRWDIEPFHKILKSTLRLTKEFQLRSFDAITAHTAIVLTRYVFLSLENRENKDSRSIGEVFLLVCDELEDISFQYVFNLILSILKQNLLDSLTLSSASLQFLVDGFFAALPSFIKARMA